MLVALLLTGAALAVLPNAAAFSSPTAPPIPGVVCNPDFAGVCYSIGANGACVGVNFGLQGAGACVFTDPAGVRVCTSARSIFWDGFCPTDGTILDEIIYFP
jgi:hypothetical protein